jgi:branched-subunit amino acid aminotransferase/4-amino-4-deoxychorismate lyase
MADGAMPMADPGGVMVVSNCRTWHGKLFRWADHQARFRRDCRDCCIALPYSDEELTAAAESLLDGDCHIVTVAAPGLVGISTKPVDAARDTRFATEGAMLRVAGHQPVDESALLPPRIKHRSRLIWHLAAHKVFEHEIAVLTDSPGGTLTETAIGNVLAVRDNVLYTPPRKLLLDGIGLRVTLELADAMGLLWQERDLTIREIPSCDEWLLVGSGLGIAAVSRFNGVQFAPGPWTRKLIAAWALAVRKS